MISTYELAAEFGGMRGPALAAYAKKHGVKGKRQRREVRDQKGLTIWRWRTCYTPAQADKIRRLRGFQGKGN